jgi:hypothetical protein
LNTVEGLYVGRDLSFNVSGLEEMTIITGCGTTTMDAACTSTNVTFSPALSSAPDIPGDVDWGLVPSNLDLLGNYIGRPSSWYTTPIVATPTSVNATPSTSGGTLAAGTTCYRVTARIQMYVAVARSAASTEVCAAHTGSTGSVALTWTPVANAETYYIYKGASGSQNVRYSSTTASFTDTGAAGTTETVPTSAGDTWFMKNTLEFKIGRDIYVYGNIIENAWKDGQNGFCLVYTGANTGNGNDSTVLRDVVTEYNIIRHCAGGIQFLGRDVSSAQTPVVGQPSGRFGGYTFRHNLFYDMGPQWGVSVQWMLISTTNSAGKSYYPGGEAAHPMGPYNVIIDHNTIMMEQGQSLINLDLYKGEAREIDNITFSNNLAFRTSYGLTGANSCAQGTGCWDAYTKGTVVYQNNVIADAVCANYPGGCTETLNPTAADLKNVHINDYAAEDFSLAAGSAYNNAATDGTDIGADIPAVLAATGGLPPPAEPDPPVIITTLLPNATVGIAYNEPIAVTAGTVPISCSVVTGSVPAGLALTSATCTITGSATTPGTSAFTVRATDSFTPTARADDQDLSITVVAAPSTLTITTTSPLPVATQFAGYSHQFELSGGTGPYVWSISSGTPPAALSMQESGQFLGTVTASPSGYSFTARVADSLGNIATKAMNITVNAPASNCNRSNTTLGGLSIQGATFVGPTAPVNDVCIGDSWKDTSFSPPRDNVAISGSPSATWVREPRPAEPHLWEQHSNVEAGTVPSLGYIMVGTGSNWAPMLPGPVGDFLCSTGGGVGWCDAPTDTGSSTAAMTDTVTLRADAGNYAFVAATITGTGIQQLDSSGRHRLHKDLTNVAEARLHAMHVSGAGNTAILRVDYSTDQNSWTVTTIQFTFDSTIGVIKSSPWTAVPAGMKGDVYIRIIATNGDGTEAPQVGNVYLEFRQ